MSHKTRISEYTGTRTNVREMMKTCLIAVAALGITWLFLILLSAVIPLWLTLPFWGIGIIAGLVIAGALWALR